MWLCGTLNLILTQHSRGKHSGRMSCGVPVIDGLRRGVSLVPRGDRSSRVVDKTGTRTAKELRALKKLSTLSFLIVSFTKE